MVSFFFIGSTVHRPIQRDTNEDDEQSTAKTTSELDARNILGDKTALAVVPSENETATYVRRVPVDWCWDTQIMLYISFLNWVFFF